MPRHLTSASSHVIVCSAGGLSATGNWGTVAAVIKRGSTTGWNSVVQMGGNRAMEIEPGTGNRIYGWNFGGFSPTFTVTPADNWVLIGITKVSGTNTPRFHKYVYDTDTYAAENASGTVANGSAGGASNHEIGNSGGDFFDGEIAVVGVWDRALSDAEVQALPFSLQWWYASAPDALWVLDQEATTTNVLDATGKGANQSSLTGTTVSTVSVPVLSYGFPVTSWAIPAAAAAPQDTPELRGRPFGQHGQAQMHQLLAQ